MQAINRLFAYGTLMCEDIMTEVSGLNSTRLQPAGIPAVIHGFIRYPVRNQVFPGIIAKPGSRVTGLVYNGIDDSAWQRLDLFESEMYTHQPVEAELQDGKLITAMVYVVQDHYHHLLCIQPRHESPNECPNKVGDLSHNRSWDFDNFLARHKDDYYARLRNRNKQV